MDLFIFLKFKVSLNFLFRLDSIAQHAGLLVGDFLIKINGKNVSRATCDSIVKIIKYVFLFFLFKFKFMELVSYGYFCLFLEIQVANDS